MPTLEWIGKSKVVNHHQEVPFRVLERQYSFDEMGKHTEDNGSDNHCYERLLNCKMIFQLLYWAYQSFFGRMPQ